MKLAFHAPMKSPDHPTPSGDRSMARALIRALEHLGAEVTLASTFRSRDGAGDAVAQAALMAQADALIPGLIGQGQAEGWKAWITYHCYYKAPDLLGPATARALGIPYLLIEATRASKRLVGPWACFARAAEAAMDEARVIFYLTTRDAEALRRDAPVEQALIHLRPFLPLDALPPQGTRKGPMLSVGMLRRGDKLASYQLIAQTLLQLPKGWQLHIAGDGAARSEIEALMAPFGRAVTFLGALDTATLAECYENAALLFWPGVNEAFGLTYLEAQARGLPVVAQDRPGVRDVLAPGSYPAPENGTEPMAARLSQLLADPDLRHSSGTAARAHIGAHHLLPAAAATLRDGLARVGVAA